MPKRAASSTEQNGRGGRGGPERVVVLSDHVRGHLHQSLGVARQLQRLCGATVQTIEVPRLSGVERFLRLKLLARRLGRASPEEARRWLRGSGFPLEDRAGFLLGGERTLFLSAGSSAAPFCLALARGGGGRAAVLMTPSVLGTGPFDFAIVPEHDRPRPNANLLATLGAPNHIYRPELQAAAEARFTAAPLPSKVVALLLGGSDGNYRLDAPWVRSVLPPLRAAVEKEGAALLAATSRRTGRAADDAAETLLKDSPATRCLVLASRDPDDAPVPAMLGAATHVLVTEDSVSMASEAATAGFRVGLLRVGRTPLSRVRNLLGGGAARFDALFDAMAGRGLLDDLGGAPDFESFLAPPERRALAPFDEARRAAEWILDRWGDLRYEDSSHRPRI